MKTIDKKLRLFYYQSLSKQVFCQLTIWVILNPGIQNSNKVIISFVDIMSRHVSN